MISLFISILCKSQILKGTVQYELVRNKNTGANGLIIFLIPDITQNRVVVREITTVGSTCNAGSVQKKAKDYKMTVSDINGNFYFTGVKKGKYVLKVCTLYGSYKKFAIAKEFAGTLNLGKIVAF